MKHLKYFENLTDDIFILAYNTRFNGNLKEFIENNVGTIIYNGLSNNTYRVAYENIPENLISQFYFDMDNTNKYYVVLIKEEILKMTNNIEDIDVILTSKKYNL